MPYIETPKFQMPNPMAYDVLVAAEEDGTYLLITAAPPVEGGGLMEAATNLVETRGRGEQVIDGWVSGARGWTDAVDPDNPDQNYPRPREEAA